MSQPVLIGALAIVGATTVTVVVAIVTNAEVLTHRTLRVAVGALILAVVIVLVERARLRLNLTDSMPIGVYALAPLPVGGVKRGMFVAACAPLAAAQIGRRRGYLAAGPCAVGSELLLKSVVAVAGDEVDVSVGGVTVNGSALPHGQQVANDRSGRRLRAWPRGRFRLQPGQVWLYADNDRSWDSRYWGPVTRFDVKAKAVPVSTFPGLFRFVVGALGFSRPRYRVFCELLRNRRLDPRLRR